MEITLKNKVAVVTGGRQGIGHAVTQAFLDAGARVLTCARDDLGLQAEVGRWRTKHGDRIQGIKADVGVAEDCERLIERAQALFGGVDVLVNNAATSEAGTLTTLTDAQWHREFDVKLLAMVRTARAAAPIMAERGGGSIININAVFARQPDASFYASSVVRAGCLSLTKLIAKEFAPRRVRANAIGLGLIETPAWRAWHDPGQGSYEDFLTRTAAFYRVPMGRIGRMSEAANVALFLASDASSYVSGTQLDVDGAMAAYL